MGESRIPIRVETPEGNFYTVAVADTSRWFVLTATVAQPEDTDGPDNNS